MGVYHIGEVIRRSRESLGMTQEQLAEGICTPETLSRIENGKRTPNRANFRALMERLEKCGEKYFPYIRVGDYARMEMWQKILRMDRAHRFEEVLAELEEFEEALDLDDYVNRQAVMRMRALCNYNLGKISAKRSREMLAEALKLTVPSWDGRTVPEGVFTRTECALFCNIAVLYMNEGRLDEALDLMRQMQQYFRTTRIDERERRYSEGLLMSNLARCLGRKGETKEALEIAREETEKYLKFDMADRLHGSLYNMAYQMEVQHKSPEACKEKLVQAYYVAEFTGDGRERDHIRKHYEERYGELSI